MTHEIFWNGHLCEGDRIVTSNPNTFILWTRCGKHDVPANQGYTGPSAEQEIKCPDCLSIWQQVID